FDITNLSPDLTIPSGETNPTTQVLSDTPGTGTGWTFAELNTRELVPRVTVNDSTLYAADSFFIDMNDNQIYDDGTDRMLTDDALFTTADIHNGVITIVPHVRVLYSDINISFASDGNAVIDTTGIETQYRSIDTWQTVIDTGLPTTTGVGYYYNFEGWYLNNIKVQSTDLLVNGGVYVAKFVKNTDLADAPKKVLYTTTIDDYGNGQINIRDIHSGYAYILADVSDTILSKALVVDTTLSFTHDADGVDINTKYHLYEVKIDETVTFDGINTGDNISTIDASHRSDSNDCYVPAVRKNYTVAVDNSLLNSGTQNVAKVTIKPTSVDYEYALYEGTAMADGIDWTPGAVSGITFEGIKPGKTYKVVTKKNGTATTTQGTNIYIDTLNNLTNNSYIVYAINATINGENSAIVEAGQTVTVTANDSSSAFQWTSSAGVSFSSQNAETTFTMPSKNVVVMPKRVVPDTNKIKLNSVQFGNSDYSVYMDSYDEDTLVTNLRTDAETYLSNHGFNIKYNVTFNKDILTFEEQSALVNEMGDAARGALAIDVEVERYIDNKRVDSNAFVNPPSTLTGSSLYGNTQISEELTNLYGSEIFDQVPGLLE
ncbi:MAG: hypothetical protein IJ593_06765, partial [Lachnospiraceae bacterium]|nr:hypothetical protein [Lachnospiraceae bacterium]